ncbi:unnamed protein product [Brugia pahangi]|uniref:Uncharacterized protein n=1 Tax=Brugia pahangi TaxID=6280 RepID=A0A158PSL7_BRUPA|nr:unnamed protein product [Brugia pahangi]
MENESFEKFCKKLQLYDTQWMKWQMKTNERSCCTEKRMFRYDLIHSKNFDEMLGIICIFFMAEVKPKLRRVVTFTRNNHRWSRTFDENDLRKDEEPKSKGHERVETDRKDVSDNGSKNVAFKRSQTMN